MNQKVFRLASFKALDGAKGIFEALVAVFNNVDRAGDMIVPGAFAESLAAWKEKERPIPVVFAHQWDNLDAHIGEVLEAKEVPEGLYVKGQLEMDEPFAQRVWKKMSKGTLAEFSFAYDVLDSSQAKVDGAYVNELRKLNLLEVGPCLVGMNPETQLLGVKENFSPLPPSPTRGGGELSPQGKEGRRNSSKDAARIQAIHDAACDLGAKCAEVVGEQGEGEGADTGKALPRESKPGVRPSTLAARVAAELLEL